jgi:hypothetical protein
MFTNFGGRTVGKGTYWNLTSGERIDVNTPSALPGRRDDRYVKIPFAGLCIAGPLAGLLFTVVIPFLFLIAMLAFLPRTVHANASVSEEAQTCLGCHATPGMTMTFQDKSTISVQVDENHFAASVHGSLDCTGCHSDVSMDNHPSAQYASKKQFLLHLASACRTCHAEEQIMANKLHQRAITKANAPPCSECHGSHAISKVPTQKEKLSTSQYCLTCHHQKLTKSVNGEVLSLAINEEWIKHSVHSQHSCTDCHTSYSKSIHPTPELKSLRDLTITASEACARCHPDKSAQHKGSVHSAMLEEGIKRAPACVDCHGAHSVGPKALADTMSGVPCKKCHEDIFAAYRGSVHGMAKQNGNGQAPICSDCHYAHEIKPAMASRSPKEVCMGCHPGVAAAHQKWLPNAEAHFDAVACTACHIPQGYKRSVYLRATEGEKGMMVSDGVMRKLLAGSKVMLAAAKGNQLEADELWRLYNDKSEGENVHLSGTVNVNDRRHAHRLAPKTEAVRQCEWCHSANAAFFQSVSMAVAKKDGREALYKVDAEALKSVYAMIPLSSFYVLGGTRVTALDYIGAAMILGGMMVPIAHGTLRYLTRRLRWQRQHARRGGSK